MEKIKKNNVFILLPTEAINDGIIRGMITHLSIFRKICPMYPMYITSLKKKHRQNFNIFCLKKTIFDLDVHFSSLLAFKQAPSTTPEKRKKSLEISRYWIFFQ